MRSVLSKLFLSSLCVLLALCCSCGTNEPATGGAADTAGKPMAVETKQPVVEELQPTEPEAKQPTVEEPGAKEQEAEQPKIEQPLVKQPETQKAETDKTEAKEPPTKPATVQDKPKEPSVAKAAVEPTSVVAKIGDYTITADELEKRLMNELRPGDYGYTSQTEPVDARTVLLKMIAEKAMVMEARKQDYLQREEIETSVNRFKERRLANSLLRTRFEDKVTVAESEIDDKLKADPKLDRVRAMAMVQREKANRLVNQYYGELHKKFHVKKLSENFTKAADIYERLLYRPKEPRKVGWVRTSQMKDEVTPEEKSIILATYDGGKVTLKDWFDAISEMAPPRRPRDLGTPKGAERLLDQSLRMPIFVAEATLLGLDEDEDFVKQVRAYEDRRLLSEITAAKHKEVEEPTDEQIAAYFNENKKAFGKPETLKIDQIWCQDLQTARKAKAELDGGTDFESVKQTYSLQKKSTPFNTYPGSEGMFWEDLWKGDPNEIVGPVKGFSGDGFKWRIVKILEKTPGEPKEYSDDTKNRAKWRMLDEQRKAALADYRKELLEKYSYEIYSETIKDIDPLNIP